MKRSNRLILLIGILLAVVAFGGIYLALQEDPNQGAGREPEQLNTIYSAVEIPLGVAVTQDMLAEQMVAVENRDPNAFADVGLVVGKIARRNIAAGTQLTAADFGTNTATIETPPGLRAMAVQVDQVSGVGTLINPGDYVDMVVGFTGEKFPVITIDPEAEDASQFTVLSGVNQTTVKVLIPGVQVLGTLVPPPAAGAEPAPGATPAPALTGQQQIVIVAVSAQQTEIIKFSQMDGSITLVLRSAEDFVDPTTGQPIVPAEVETSGIILRTLVEEYGVLVPELIETILPAQPGTSPGP